MCKSNLRQQQLNCCKKAFNPNSQQPNQTQQLGNVTQPKPKTEFKKPQFQKPVQKEQEDPIQTGYAEMYPGNNGNRQQLSDDDIWQ